MSPLPSRGSPPLQCGGQNQKWPTCGQSGYVTPAVSGIPTAAQRGAKSEVAHLWAKWLRHPCRLGDPHRYRATSPLLSRGSPPLLSRGAKSEVAHLWAKWPRHPCRLRDPHRCKAGGKSEVPHLWAKWLCHPCRLGDPHRCKATSPLLCRGSPPLQSGGQNQKWPTCGQRSYVTPTVSGIPTASERGAKSEVAHLWAKWLRHPCRLGDPHRFRAGGRIRSGPLVGKVATSPLPSRGSPPLQSGGQNQKWPTCGQSGYVTFAVSGIPTVAKRGGKIRSGPLVGKVATSPLLSRGSPPLQSGGEIKSGPLVGKVATSPLPSRGSPPLQSGGQT